MDRKEEIYNFIQAYYRNIMNDKKNKLIEFNINKKYKNYTNKEKKIRVEFKKEKIKEKQLKDRGVPF